MDMEQIVTWFDAEGPKLRDKLRPAKVTEQALDYADAQVTSGHTLRMMHGPGWRQVG
jgi:hypothetical protein